MVVIVELLPAEVLELAALTMFPVELVVASSDEARRGDDVEIEQPGKRPEESLERCAPRWSVAKHRTEESDPMKDQVLVAVAVAVAVGGRVAPRGSCAELLDGDLVEVTVPEGRECHLLASDASDPRDESREDETATSPSTGI